MSGIPRDIGGGGSESAPRRRYAWAAPGDVNAFFGLMLDNIGVMILMATILIGYGFPESIVLGRMIPGTALGVLIGDLIYTRMAFGLARRSGRTDVTAMPLGLDTPSTFGVATLILGPAFQVEMQARSAAGLPPDPQAAAYHAWMLGMALMLAAGLFKLACAPLSGPVRRLVPRAGLLGSLVAIALVVISFVPLLDIVETPVAGLVALFVILATLTARWELPGPGARAVASVGLGLVAAYLLRLPPSPFGWFESGLLGVAVAGAVAVLLTRSGPVPGALMALALGAVVYYGMHALGLGPGPATRPTHGAAWSLGWPLPGWIDWMRGHGATVAAYLPVALPLALATVVGGIDCAESAASVGDDYPTGRIIATEGFATLVAGLFGGVIQTTPYIGHPAYKAMGGRAGYTLATALFVGAAGLLGFFGWIFHVVPRPAVFPILVYVGIEITQQSFRATPRRHYPALVLACVPALAYLAALMVGRIVGDLDRIGNVPPGGGFLLLDPGIRHFVQTLAMLAGGFIVTSLLWGTALARLIDGHWRTAAAVLALAGLLAAFGVIHSPLPGSPILAPPAAEAVLRESGRLAASANRLPLDWAAAYGASALVLVFFGLAGRPGRPDDEAPATDG